MAETIDKGRAYAAAHFTLELDGTDNGLIKSVEGGGIKVDVVSYQQGGIYDRWKQIGKPKFEDIKIQIAMSTGAPYYAWLEAFFGADGARNRRDGAIVAGDFYYKERARREFKFGLIRELTFPALDAAGKDALYCTIAIAVESIDYKPGVAGPAMQAKLADAPKYWKASDFRLSLGGFDTLTVSKIDAITIKQNIVEYHSGGMRGPIKTPSQIEFPNISFTIPESQVASLMKRVSKRGSAVKPTGTDPIPEGAIDYLGVDNSVLGTLNFYDAEIINIQPDKADSGSDNIRNVKVDLSVERMAFKYQKNYVT